MKLKVSRKDKKRIESFKGFTRSDLEMLENAQRRERKHKKEKLRTYKCQCGKIYYYKLIRCIDCGSKAIVEYNQIAVPMPENARLRD